MMRTKLSIYALCFTTLTYLVLSVAVTGLMRSFPHTPPDTLMLLVSLPSLTAIAGIVLVPLVSKHVSHKAIAVFGLALMLAGGCICLLFHRSLAMLFAASVLMGIAYGIVSTMFPLIANARFCGNELSRVTGVASGMIQLGRLVTVLIGGYLADMRWYYVYFVFALVAAALIAVCVCLPAQPPVNAAPAPDQKGKSGSAPLRSPSVLLLSLTGMCFAALYFINSSHASLYIEAGGLGTASTTGAISAFGCLFAGVQSLFFGPIYRRTGRYTLALAFLILGLGYALTGAVPALWSAAVGFAASASAIALFTPWLMLSIGAASTPESSPAVAAVVISAVNVGYTLSPAVTNFLSRAISGTVPDVFLSVGVVSLAFGMLFLWIERGNARRKKEVWK